MKVNMNFKNKSAKIILELKKLVKTDIKWSSFHVILRAFTTSLILVEF